MTRRDFLKFFILLGVFSLIRPLGVWESLKSPKRNFDLSYRRKGRVYKFQPPFSEVVSHQRVWINSEPIGKLGV